MCLDPDFNQPYIRKCAGPMECLGMDPLPNPVFDTWMSATGPPRGRHARVLEDI